MFVNIITHVLFIDSILIACEHRTLRLKHHYYRCFESSHPSHLRTFAPSHLPLLISRLRAFCFLSVCRLPFSSQSYLWVFPFMCRILRFSGNSCVVLAFFVICRVPCAALAIVIIILCSAFCICVLHAECYLLRAVYNNNICRFVCKPSSVHPPFR